jgi:hypothetical protein
VALDEEKPVATPGDIAGDFLSAGDFDRHVLRLPIARNVVDRSRAIAVQGCRDDAHGRLDAMLSGTDATQMRERRHQPDGAVTAHAEVAGVVEEKHTGSAGRIAGFHEHRTHDHIRASRLIDHCGAKAIVLRPESLQALRQSVAAEIRAPIDDDSRGLSASMRIDDAYLLHDVYFTI